MSELLRTLGFPEPRRNRTRCILHDGENSTSFSVDADRGLWYCFRCGEGGGKLLLVQRALKVDRRAALHYLADLVGVQLSNQPLTPERKQEWVASIEERELMEHFRAKFGSRPALSYAEACVRDPEFKDWLREDRAHAEAITALLIVFIARAEGVEL